MIVILDGHGYTLAADFGSLLEMRVWMKAEDPGLSFCVTDFDWSVVVESMREQNCIYLKTGADVDMVISHRPAVLAGV